MRKTRTKSVYRAGVGIRHGACTREEGADKPACTRLLPFVSAAFDTISAAHAWTTRRLARAIKIYCCEYGYDSISSRFRCDAGSQRWRVTPVTAVYNCRNVETRRRSHSDELLHSSPALVPDR